MILTESEVKSYLSNAGFKGVALNYATQICYCESGYNTNALNLTSREDSRGLMQINVIAHPEYSNLDLFNPGTNCMVAYQIYQESGNNFGAWTCANLLNLVNPNIFYYGIGLALFGLTYYIYNK